MTSAETDAEAHGCNPAALVFVDTNILLAATDRSRTGWQAATTFLNEDPRRLAVSPQIVREYLAVATRPVEGNGLGLAVGAALHNVEQFLADIEILVEDTATTRRLRDLLDEFDVYGKQVHDANVVAVAVTHSATSIVTDNARHFSRFADLIAIEPMTTLDAEVKRRSTSRSALLAAAARRELARQDPAELTAAIERSERRFSSAGSFESAELIRSDRDDRR